VIAGLTTDLLTKIRTIPDLSTRTGLTIGGKSQDPGMLKVPLPASWVSFKSDQVDERDFTHGPASGYIVDVGVLMGTWAAMIFVPYNDDADMLSVQLPLLEAVAGAVHGTEAPSGFRWRYIGQRIALVYPDRLAYELKFTVNFCTTPT
jgi:hypothetical protein